MKSKLGVLAMTAALLSGDDSLISNLPLRPEDIDTTLKEPLIPNGCKRHYFNKYGECPKGQHMVYFDAMKKKSAIIKWERWLNCHI